MRNGMIRAAALLVGLATTMTAMTARADTKKVTVPAGTRILVRMADSIDSSKQKAGFRFTGSLETNLQADDVVVARRGTPVYGVLGYGFIRRQDERQFRTRTGADGNRDQRNILSAADQHVRDRRKRRRLEYGEESCRRRGIGCAYRRASRRRKRSWHWRARRCGRGNGSRRYQEGAANLDSQRISDRVPAGTTGGAAGRKIAERSVQTPDKRKINPS